MNRHLNQFLFLILVCSTASLVAQSTSKIDWLIDSSSYSAQISESNEAISLSNGLIHRKIYLGANAATVVFENLVTGEQMLRSIKPEAEIAINDSTYAVGGLVGLKEHGYFLEDWLPNLSSDSLAFQFSEYRIKQLEPNINYKGSKRYNTSERIAPSGKELILRFHHKAKELERITVSVHYAIFDEMPVLSKWVTVENQSDNVVTVTGFKNEILAFPEVENAVEPPSEWKRPNIHVESDYAFGGFTTGESNVTTFWSPDPEYTSQVNWLLETPCLLESKLEVGPNALLKHGDTFESFKIYELLLDGTERERNTLSVRKMYRKLAPWVTENPIFMHLTSTDEKVVKTAIDQCAATDYEMVILSFGSGLNMEDTTAVNISKFKKLADYAHKKGIQLGGYSLFSSRKIADSVDVIDKETGKPGGAKFLNAPCLASQWGYEYIQKIAYFLDETGFDLLEHDGPYPGDYCASTSHRYHKGYEDSQWVQWKMSVDFYNTLREKDIYLNAPDFYFLQGSNKCGIGYREVNWSLPRDQQILLGRQNIYDGTWEKAPSMAWTFVPLTEYHGGGEAATLEPLKEHLNAYEAHMVQNYGAGVQACYRGPRLFDSKETKTLVQNQIEWYKKYRQILNADLIHLRRANGRTWDGFMHVDPKLKEKGMILLFNPTSEDIDEVVNIPLYYTGLETTAKISENDELTETYNLNRDYTVDLPIQIPAGSYTWLTVR
ncbi:alpha-galactosidase [Pseudozobellia sp. WGM2]|uniref:alpha-galactosidase n=1 Tax=Pseudozobellia sp. WGM2 TaxID=2787625 RepID=UPI001ADF0B11|nr:alpha-galactosidase [Pseudozobellia sp. WGM2]